MNSITDFKKSFWSYYLELEQQFLETKRYVEFSSFNGTAYSIEYLKLYQAICSEIDVVGKEIAANVVPCFKADKNTDIKKWGYNLQRVFSSIKDSVVCFYELYNIKPFVNWMYEEATDKRGHKYLRIVGEKKTIVWWRNYNKVKHQRIGLISGEENFQLANQENVVLSLAALFLLEWTYMTYINKGGEDVAPSQLFVVKELNE